MGLLDFFGGGSGTKVEKLQKAATQKYGPPENRQSALQELAKLATPEAYMAMLRRFAVHSEPTITDREEKEFVLGQLRSAGEKAKQPIKDFVRQSDSAINWALQALETLAQPAEVIEFCLETLGRIGPDYTRDPEKKTVLLKYLEESQPDPRIPGPVKAFLEDPADDVKLAAARVLTHHALPDVRDALCEALVRDRETKRVLAGYCDALVELGLPLEQHLGTVGPLVARPYSVVEGKVVRAA